MRSRWSQSALFAALLAAAACAEQPTAPLAAQCRSCEVDKEPRASERPSDHAPVVAEFDV